MNEKELDILAIEIEAELKYELEQLRILKQGLDGLYTKLSTEKNVYAAGYLAVDIDRLQEVIDNYTKPLETNSDLHIHVVNKNNDI